MTDADRRAAFLKAIVEEPDDDALRLIFADWLHDHGDPDLAAFIRDQVEFRPGAADWDLFDANLERWCPWLERHDTDGFARRPDKGGALHVRHLSGETTLWRRGFLAEIYLPSRRWLEIGPEVFRGHPLEVVALTDKRPTEYQHGTPPEAYWRWFDGSRADGTGDDGDDELPGPLWDAYVMACATGVGMSWEHPTWEEASAAVSRGCLRYARLLADPLLEFDPMADGVHVRLYHDDSRRSYSFAGIFPDTHTARRGYVRWAKEQQAHIPTLRH